MIIPFETAPNLLGVEGLSHGFFGRGGGVSGGLYEGLNVGPGSEDDPALVQENRRRLGASLAQVGQTPVVLSAYQIHSAKAVIVDELPEAGVRPEGDALVTKRPNVALCALAADCAPVLLADAAAGVIASVHAGWKGAVAGVIESALEAMATLGAEPGRTLAAIGPCISRSSFEVGPDLRERVLAASSWAEALFDPGRGDRLFFDLKAYCEARLVRAGVSSVHVNPDDTLSQPSRYFSARHAGRNGYSDYGRNGSAICRFE